MTCSANPPTRPLRPVKTDNTCPLRITATAGTKLVGATFLKESKSRLA